MRLTELVDWYYGTEAFKGLKPESQRHYRFMLNEALTILGHKRITKIRWHHVEAMQGRLREEHGEHRVVSVCRVLRRVFYLAIRGEHVKGNPFARLELKALPIREVTWEPQEVWSFVLAADSMGHSSLGTLALFCYVFCQRPGDMRKLTAVNLAGARLNFTQEKRGSLIDLEVPEIILKRIGNLYLYGYGPILNNSETNQGFTKRDYNALAFDVKRRAGIDIEKQLRDLRSTGLTQAADNGATDRELMNLGGHKSVDMLKIYVKRTRALADHAMAKRIGNM